MHKATFLQLQIYFDQRRRELGDFFQYFFYIFMSKNHNKNQSETTKNVTQNNEKQTENSKTIRKQKEQAKMHERGKEREMREIIKKYPRGRIMFLIKEMMQKL